MDFNFIRFMGSWWLVDGMQRASKETCKFLSAEKRSRRRVGALSSLSIYKLVYEMF